jgi:hypothetical protein
MGQPTGLAEISKAHVVKKTSVCKKVGNIACLTARAEVRHLCRYER